MPSKFDPKKNNRRSIRLQGYDYAQAGAYYVTIVAWQREFLFGEVVNKEMVLNEVGKIIQWEWKELPKRLQFFELGAFVVMPNHFHGILMFHEDVGATRQELPNVHSGNVSLPNVIIDGIDGSPLPRGPQPKSLGAIMAQFKSRVTKRLWKIPSLNGTPIWQRNYYEHIIRNQRDLQNKTDYVEANPMLWDEDDENPLNVNRRDYWSNIMSIFENRGSYLFVKITETYSLKWAFSFLREFTDTCKQEHLEKALIDGLILEGPIIIWDRYQIGEEFVRVVGPKIKVALIGKRDLIDLTMENVVVNRTGRFKGFHFVESALKWLESSE